MSFLRSITVTWTLFGPNLTPWGFDRVFSSSQVLQFARLSPFARLRFFHVRTTTGIYLQQVKLANCNDLAIENRRILRTARSSSNCNTVANGNTSRLTNRSLRKKTILRMVILANYYLSSPMVSLQYVKFSEPSLRLLIWSILEEKVVWYFGFLTFACQFCA